MININNFKNKFSIVYVVILLLILLLPFNRLNAAGGEIASTTGIVNATVVDRVLELEDLEADLAFELTVDIDEDGSQWLNQEKIISKMVAEPDSTMKVYYGDDALSKEDNSENDEGFAVVVLKDEEGNTIKVKLKIDESRIVFDEKGKAELKVDSEFFVGENQPRGSYKATYYVVITH